MFHSVTTSFAVALTLFWSTHAFSNLTITGNPTPQNPLHLQPDTDYTVSFDTSGDNPSNQWVALLVLNYQSPISGARPLMPVCVLQGGLMENSVGKDTVGASISFAMKLSSDIIPSSISAAVEVGQLTPDGVVLLSTSFNFLGTRFPLTSVESAGVPVNTVELLCSDYAATINSTGPNCVAGTGPDNFADLCKFACKNGFCNSPCTCTSTGAGSSPVPANSAITATGAPGLNSSFDPLCNFACPRGFCPTAVCDPDLQAGPTMDLPAITNLTEFESSATSYVEGNSFITQSPVNASLSLDLILVGNSTTWDDINCGVAAAPPGADGDTMGCVAMAVAYLIYGIAEGDTRVLDNLSQVPRSLAVSDADFTVHPDWRPDGNCTTTRCMLLATAPVDTWVHVGNGTLNGIHHEMQFMRSGSMIRHAVTQHPPSDNSSTAGKVADRSNIYFAGTEARVRADMGYYDPKLKWDPLRHILVSDGQQFSADAIMTGQAVEAAVAESHFDTFCLQYLQEGTTGEIAYLLSIDQGGSIGVNPIEASHNYQKCLSEQNAKTPCVVWPQDPTDTAEVQTLLASLGAVASHSTWQPSSILYWTVKLSPVDRIRVKSSKQVLSVDDECFSNCFDFDDGESSEAHEERTFGSQTDLKSVTGRKLKTFETQSYSDPIMDKALNHTLGRRESTQGIRQKVDLDLSFVSQIQSKTPNTVPDGSYTFDNLLGLGTTVYLLDRDFRVQHTEFANLQYVMAALPPGQTVDRTSNDQQIPQHGTRVLSQLAGATKGVASRVKINLHEVNHNQDSRFIIDHLDSVRADWGQIAPQAPTPLGVLNMSFGTKKSIASAGYSNGLYLKLKSLIEAGVVPVISTGNEGFSQERLPRWFINCPNAFFRLNAIIDVGSVENNGERSPLSNYYDGTLYAPGNVDSAIIKDDQSSGFEEVWGTSFAAPKVSGVAAYLFSLSSHWKHFAPDFAVQGSVGNGKLGDVTLFKQYLLKLAYPRDQAQVLKAIYNGIDTWPNSGPV